jgi:membrane fusion protein (multidrug efflux system)
MAIGTLGPRLGRLVPLLLLAAVAGCDRPNEAAQAPPAPPPAVTVVAASEGEVRPSSTFTGRIVAVDKVDLRARVEGFLEQRLFTEGQHVAVGDLLFVIEKAPYEAHLAEVQAAIERSQASLQVATLQRQRYEELVKRQASPQAQLDEAVAREGEAKGQLLAEQARLQSAQLDLDYTEIRAPIAGRIGRASFSVGNFVGPSSGTLATIVSQDPVYVTFPVTQRELLAVREEIAAQGGDPAATAVRIQLADGKTYGHVGKIDFLDVKVDPSTDSVTVRASLPNPRGTGNLGPMLADGQLVQVIVETAQPETAILIPQESLQLDQAGAFVMVVDDERKAQVRRIEIGRGPPGKVRVTKGLSAGERVITQGIQRVRPGLEVNAAEAATEPPAAGATATAGQG